MKTPNPYLLLLLSTPLVAFSRVPQTPKSEQKLPNIVYILTDDLGYGDITVNNPEAKTNTPNIDRLAKQGIRFTDAHSTSAVCTPTRYGILTGRYSWRTVMKSGVLNGYSLPLIDRDRTTVASLLKKNGYTTGVVGKWHLGLGWVKKNAEAKEPILKPADENAAIIETIDPATLNFSRPPYDGPTNHGFDYSYILPASLDMPPYCYLENDRLTSPLTDATNGNDPANGTTSAFWRKGLMAQGFVFDQVTPTFTQKAISFITKQSTSGKPFFLYLPFPSPHTPWLPLKEFQGSSKAGEYGDFVNMVDAQVGKVLKALNDLGLDNNTIVFFASDNGPFWRPNFIEKFNHKAAYIYRGMKADAFEGGHRIPFIVRWPGKIKAGSQCAETINLTNLLATCSGIVGNKLLDNEGEDSFSILPLLLGKEKDYVRPEALIQHSSRGLFVVRQGDWKLILGLGSGGFSKPETIQPKEGEAPGQLFNLKDDPSETKNLYLQFPGKVEALSKILKKYQESGRSRF
ncbi:MAG TPA: arylsulfatase [Prolixibacteraceae bacterium]